MRDTVTFSLRSLSSLGPAPSVAPALAPAPALDLALALASSLVAVQSVSAPWTEFLAHERSVGDNRRAWHENKLQNHACSFRKMATLHLARGSLIAHLIWHCGIWACSKHPPIASHGDVHSCNGCSIPMLLSFSCGSAVRRRAHPLQQTTPVSQEELSLSHGLIAP